MFMLIAALIMYGVSATMAANAVAIAMEGSPIYSWFSESVTYSVGTAVFTGLSALHVSVVAVGSYIESIVVQKAQE